MINLDGSVIEIEEVEVDGHGDDALEHDVEDWTSTSAVLQSSESSMTFHDEDEITTMTLGEMQQNTAKQQQQQRKSNTRRHYVFGVSIMLLVAGCGYLATNHASIDDEASNSNTSPSAAMFSDHIVTPEEATAASSTAASKALPMPKPAELFDGASVLRSGRRFQIHMPGNSNSCLGASAAAAAGSGDWMRLQSVACDGQESEFHQAFVYDPFTRFLVSASKPGWCIDSGNGSDGLRLHPCGQAGTSSQTFEYSAAPAFRSVHDDLCIDSSAASEGQGGVVTLAKCDSTRGSQHVYPIPIADNDGSSASSSMWQVNHPILRNGDPFLLRTVGKFNLCMHRGDASSTTATNSNSNTDLWLRDCDPNDASQLFTYNVQSHTIQSAADPTLCLDDSGDSSAVSNGVARLRMTRCSNEHSAHQKLVYDDFTRMFRKPMEPTRCLDDGGDYTSATSASQGFRVKTCDLSSGDQQFQILLRSTLYSVSASVVLANQKPFVVESMYKGLCLDDDGAEAEGSGFFRLASCGKTSFALSQVFWYDTVNQMVRSVKTPNLCWSTNNDTKGLSLLQLASCDPSSPRQRFAYNVDTFAFLRLSHDQEQQQPQCLDDGGGAFAQETRLSFAACELHRSNQQFYLRAA
uniref:Ricin B lectin domain-containing protein n=1 Tax=Globisporangium ultimum (strain ATCC 200006 / CBS 805.95 / DAOM BR144) TaxID=431595 RepID=K3X3R3_GLOUD